MKYNPSSEFNANDRIGIKLLENSIHFLDGEITEDNINEAIRWIVYENVNSITPKVLTLYINSLGGSLYDAFALIDVMNKSKHSIRTIGVGSVMSAAFLIFISGTRGERYIGKNAGIMCHQYSDAPEGKHHDLKAQMKEGENCHQRMIDILRTTTDLPVTKIKGKLLHATDVYLTADEALALNVADHIL